MQELVHEITRNDTKQDNTNWGDPHSVRQSLDLHTWLSQDFAFQSDHCSTELGSTGEAEVSSAGEQLTKE